MFQIIGIRVGSEIVFLDPELSRSLNWIINPCGFTSLPDTIKKESNIYK